MELNYKAINIAKAEVATGMDFFTCLSGLGDGTPSMSAILMLIMAGGLTEDKASDLLDDKGLEEAMRMVAEALGKAGFLAKARLAENAKSEASQTTGENKKA